MKFIDEKLNDIIELTDKQLERLLPVNIKTNETYKYCKLKDRNCFDYPEYQCANYRELVKYED